MSLFNKKPVFNYSSDSGKLIDNSVISTGDDQDEPEYIAHGSAWWISDRLKNLYTERKDGIPTLEGLWIGGGFFHHKEGNLTSIAPPGTGKGAALIIPNLLWKRNYPHSFVVFDPKGTHACITARFQKETGQKVHIIDPMGLQKLNGATHGIPPANFNPLDHIKKDIFNGAAQIANLLIPDDPNGEKFWNADARNLVQVIIMHIMTDDEYKTKRTLVTLYRIMLTEDLKDVLDKMIRNTAESYAISDIAISFINMYEETEVTFASVRSVANSSIKWLSNPALQACMKSSDFNPEDLEKGGSTIYICQPIQNTEGFASFSRLIVGFCLRANSSPKPGKQWVYYLLDEFPTMGVFPEVIQSLAYSREYKMRIWIFSQSISYLDWVYQEHARNQILGTSKIVQVFKSTDLVTQEYISRRIGLKTLKIITQSTSRSEGFSKAGNGYVIDPHSSKSTGTSSTDAESLHGYPLISTWEVHYDENIITITEWGPMRLSRWQYWQKNSAAEYYYNKFNDGRADPNPNITNFLNV